MATTTINENGPTITTASGEVVPVPAGYLTMTLGAGAHPELITWADGRELWVTRLRDAVLPVVRDLADGETFTGHDGCTWTRCGDEVIVRAPRQVELAAAA